MNRLHMKMLFRNSVIYTSFQHEYKFNEKNKKNAGFCVRVSCCGRWNSAVSSVVAIMAA